VRTNPIASFGAVAVDGVRIAGRDVRVGEALHIAD
jgi:hypothetical protein